MLSPFETDDAFLFELLVELDCVLDCEPDDELEV